MKMKGKKEKMSIPDDESEALAKLQEQFAKELETAILNLDQKLSHRIKELTDRTEDLITSVVGKTNNSLHEQNKFQHALKDELDQLQEIQRE